MADDALTTEQLQAVVAENDTETSLGEALSEALDESGATFPDDPIPAKLDEEELAEKKVEAKDKETPGEPEKSDDAPDKKSVSDDEVAAKSPEESESGKTDQVKDSEAKGATGSLTPPGTWSAEERAEFIELPEKAQSAILRREGDRDRAFGQKQTEMDRAIKQYADLDQVLEPHKEGLALRGMTSATLLSQYIATSQALAENPKDTLRYLAEQYGVDLSIINQAAPEETPEIAKLRRELNETRAAVTQFQNSQNQQHTDLQGQRRAALANTLTTFANAQDETGGLKYPHFEELRKDMSAMVSAAGQQGQEMDLDEAYQRALWASPVHRESLLAHQSREMERKAEDDRKAHAVKAAKAGKSVAGAPGGGGDTPAPQDTLRGELEKAFAAQ